MMLKGFISDVESKCGTVPLHKASSILFSIQDMPACETLNQIGTVGLFS